MSDQAYSNPQNPYWAPVGIVADVEQLELSVAYSSLTRPAAHTITTWADQGTGTYPLSDNRGATESTTITIQPNTGEIAAVDNIQFTSQGSGTAGLHKEGTNLYWGATQLDAASGDVTGPASNTANAVPTFSGTTGKVIQNSTLTYTSDQVDVPVTGGYNIGGAAVARYVPFNNLFLGAAGNSTVTGVGNVMVGSGSTAPTAPFISTGQVNTLVGNGVAVNLSTGSNNTCIGQYTGGGLTSGNGNVFIAADLQGQVGNVTSGNNNCRIATGGMNLSTDPSSNSLILGNQYHEFIRVPGLNAATFTLDPAHTYTLAVDMTTQQVFPLSSWPLSTYSETTAPDVNMDSSAQFWYGSIWVDTTGPDIFMCIDPTVGAAVWKPIYVQP